MFAIGTIITMGVQIGVSLINQHYNKSNLEKIKKMQQEAKTSAQNRALERDYQKFQRSCDFQYKIEEESHTERLKTIEQELVRSFEKIAHDSNLKSHYPLNISPYVISRSVIPVTGTQLNHSRQEVFCVLTNSNDKFFNNDVVPYIDKHLCNMIASYWNKNSLHTMCYFSNTWNERLSFCDEDIDNLKSTIATPTITITPYFERNDNNEHAIIIKMNMWGIGSEVSCQLPTEVRFSSKPVKYTTEQIDEIVTKLIPSMICVAAQAIDVYYWEAYHLPPLFPILLSKRTISLSNEMRNEIIALYDELYRSLALGQVTTDFAKDNTQALELTTAMNMFNFPNRNIEFLKSCINLMGRSDMSDKLIEQTMMFMYDANTGQKCISIQNIDVRLLNFDNMKVVSELIDIANGSGNFNIAKRLTDLIVRKIRS